MTEGDSSASDRIRSLLPLTLLVAAGVVLVDQITKEWAVSTLAGHEPRHVVWTLQWNLSFNSGMAFSRGQGMGVVIGLIALVVVAVIIGAVRTNTNRTVAVAAGLVVGGALGNVVDRLFRGDGFMRGAVIDFIDFQWFPIFNVADMAVNVGGALFIIWSLFGARKAAA
jgi:signal peptidase II